MAMAGGSWAKESPGSSGKSTSFHFDPIATVVQVDFPTGKRPLSTQGPAGPKGGALAKKAVQPFGPSGSGKEEGDSWANVPSMFGGGSSSSVDVGRSGGQLSYNTSRVDGDDGTLQRLRETLETYGMSPAFWALHLWPDSVTPSSKDVAPSSAAAGGRAATGSTTASGEKSFWFCCPSSSIVMPRERINSVAPQCAAQNARPRSVRDA